MATGETISGSLADSLPTVVADARIIREFEGTWMRTCDVITQAEGTGLNWIENSIAQLSAMDITETTQNENAQQLADTLLQVEPTMVQILVKITDRTYRKIAKVVSSKFGSLAGNAMARKKDEDYISLFSGFAATADPGGGNAMTSAAIAAGKAIIRSNATEPSTSPVFAILHGFQIRDIEAEVTLGGITMPIPTGISEDWFKSGWSGTVFGVSIFEDGNITIDATDDDADGALHSKEGVVAVSGMSIKTETRRDPAFGGGADEIFMTDEYAFVERGSANPWALRMESDATAPA